MKRLRHSNVRRSELCLPFLFQYFLDDAFVNQFFFNSSFAFTKFVKHVYAIVCCYQH